MPDLMCAHSIMVQPQHLPQLSHRQLSFRWHQTPPRPKSRGWILRGLTCMSVTDGSLLSLGGFVSERWAASNRNGGRHHLGMAGAIKSVNLGGFARNSQKCCAIVALTSQALPIIA